MQKWTFWKKWAEKKIDTIGIRYPKKNDFWRKIKFIKNNGKIGAEILKKNKKKIKKKKNFKKKREKIKYSKSLSTFKKF